MKVLVVLAVVAFAGCNANMMWQDQAQPSMEMVKNAFWDYVAKATQTTEDILQKIRESEMGQEVNAKISKSADAIGQYAVVLRGQMTPMTQEVMTRIFQESEQLKVRLQQDMSTVKSQLEPYVQEVMSNVQQQVEQLKKEVALYADMDAETLKATLLQKSEEMKASMEKTMMEMQAQLGPQAEELKQKMEQHMQEFQKTMIPMAENFQERMTQNAQEMKKQLDPYAEDLKTQLTTLWESFANMRQ
ncbi:apolipoprotein A-I [Astyanax mexicanus]|uniref:apolipoprotein A-I n=1 Tax=Astyanax mexicanus TaxID=7994 RepID=UPI0020CB2DC9|nr:apolipoprotein A-I [Astyanax mexicanus]